MTEVLDMLVFMQEIKGLNAPLSSSEEAILIKSSEILDISQIHTTQAEMEI